MVLETKEEFWAYLEDIKIRADIATWLRNPFPERGAECAAQALVRVWEEDGRNGIFFWDEVEVLKLGQVGPPRPNKLPVAPVLAWSLGPISPAAILCAYLIFACRPLACDASPPGTLHQHQTSTAHRLLRIPINNHCATSKSPSLDASEWQSTATSNFS